MFTLIHVAMVIIFNDFPFAGCDSGDYVICSSLTAQRLSRVGTYDVSSAKVNLMIGAAISTFHYFDLVDDMKLFSIIDRSAIFRITSRSWVL